jgi:hypothetical protein
LLFFVLDERYRYRKEFFSILRFFCCTKVENLTGEPLKWHVSSKIEASLTEALGRAVEITGGCEKVVGDTIRREF